MSTANALALVSLLFATATVQAATPHSQLADETRAALDLRARNGVHELVSASTIYVHSEARHHVAEEFTRVVSRGMDGRWTVSSIGETGPGLLRIPIEVSPEERKILPVRDGQDLDRLLHWRALYRQTSPREREVGVGAAFHTMEIVTPQGHAVFRWTGRLRGWAGAVADLVMGRG
jgi:hypothetical protein